MTEPSREVWSEHHEGLLTAVSVGFFLILIGSLFIITPNLFNKVVDFLSHFTSRQIRTTNIYAPVPENFSAHLDVYTAARLFSLVWGVFLIAMLAVRFILGSSLRQKAENLGGVVFWLGAAYLIQTYLVQPAQASGLTATDYVRDWFEFWALIVALIGVSFIARGIFLAVERAARKT